MDSTPGENCDPVPQAALSILHDTYHHGEKALVTLLISTGCFGAVFVPWLLRLVSSWGGNTVCHLATNAWHRYDLLHPARHHAGETRPAPRVCML